MQVHISRHYLGEKATFTPRVPVSQLKSEKEMRARVCASSSVEGCWLALNGSDLFTELRLSTMSGFYFFVYELEGNFEKSEVNDAEKTGEIVSYENVQGTLVDVFYAASSRMWRPLAECREFATKEEAVSHYTTDSEYVEMIKEIEDRLNEMEWEI